MKIGLQFSFNEGTMDGRYYMKLFEKFIKFEKYGFGKGNKSYPWKDKYQKEILRSDSKTRISVYSINSDILSAGVGGGAMQNEFQSIGIIQDEELFFPSNEEIKELIASDGFVSAYLYNEDYESVQFQRFHNNIKHRNIQKEIWDTVKNTPYKIGVFDIREYETNYNPGRSILMSYTWIMAAWKMWYGRDFFHIVPKEKLLAFPHAIDIKELENDIVYIQLYEKIEEPYTTDSMWRQTKWLKWIDIDMLQEKFR